MFYDLGLLLQIYCNNKLVSLSQRILMGQAPLVTVKK